MTVSLDKPVVDRPFFTAQDRCDRCRAQAYVRALFTTGDLQFCAHHGREYETALAAQALSQLTAAVPA